MQADDVPGETTVAHQFLCTMMLGDPQMTAEEESDEAGRAPSRR